jgi:hypothetical protein
MAFLFTYFAIIIQKLPMSSHHIIREKQEPALLVLGLDGFDFLRRKYQQKN